MLNSHNKGRKEMDFLVGDVIYEKKHGEINKVIIHTCNINRTIHKNNIKS